LTTPPPAQPPAADASGAPPAPLENFCAVTLIENRKWKKADPKFGAIHRGRTYLFASAENQQKFLADPDRYAPILAGYDPVRFAESGKLVAGARTHGVIYRNQIFLFADEATLGAFAKTPDRFAANAYQAMSASDQTQRR
jgi:protein disulfide-isomerase